MNHLRKLIYRFSSLPYHSRIEIANQFKLIEDEDEGVEGNELFKRVINRVKEKQLFRQLWDEVEKKSRENKRRSNVWCNRE